MNIFTQKLPDVITIDGVHYGINTDFRIWMEFDEIMHQAELSIKDRMMMVFMLCFDKERCPFLPEEPKKAMECLCQFYSVENKKTPMSRKEKNTKKAFCFSQDSGYIYSAFLTQYGIDLLKIPYLHWHVFMALFNGLDENCKLMKIIRWRLCDLSDVHDAKKREFLRKMKELHALDNQSSCDESELAEILSKAF